MIIDNIDALKSWLTNTLTPICDADPVALAKYVVALVKKDKPDEELNGLCMDQLDVFLQDKTKEFVIKLFEAIKTKSYLKIATPPLPPTSTPASTAEITDKTERDINKNRQPDDNDNIKETLPNHPREETERRRRSRSRSRSPIRGPIRSPLRVRDIRGRFDRDDRFAPRRRFDDRGPPPRRFDYDREPRFRYGGRFDDNHRRGPLPPPRDIPRAYDRSRSLSPHPRIRSRSRSCDKTRSRTPRSLSRSRTPRTRSRSFTRSRSLSRSRSKSRSRSRGPGSRSPDSRGSTPIQDREPMRAEPGYRSIQGDAHQNPSRLARPRCRDFDEKGFCMRGDLCPFDHGLDPVVVEDVALPGVIAMPPGGGPPHAGPPNLRPPHSQPPPGIHHRMIPQGPPPQRVIAPPHTEPYQPEPYNPEASFVQGQRPPQQMGPPLRHPLNMPPNRPPGPHGQLQHPGGFHGMTPTGLPGMGPRRDLVSVPTLPPPGLDQGVPQDEDLRDRRQVIAAKTPFDAAHNRRPPGFDYNRLGKGGYRRHVVTASNATLEIRKIPTELNTISKLNEHFSKFGTITNLQVAYESDNESALVTFANHSQANYAYRCPDPLFNNRFIKVFWHNKDKDQSQNGSSVSDEGKSASKPVIPPPEKMQLNNTLKNEINKNAAMSVQEKSLISASPTGHLTKTVLNQAALNSKAAAITANQNALLRANPTVALKRKKEDAIRAKLEIQKKKQELLQKHLQEQKLLIDKLEKNKSISAEEKATVMKTIKALAEGIENLKKDIVSNKSIEHKIPRTKQEAQKEILDTELELITKPPGPDTAALRHKVEELKKEAAALGLISSRGRGRGYSPMPRGGIGRGGRGRGRAAMMNVGRSFDRRPKKVKVVGFLAEDKTELTTHFAMFGQLQNTEFETNDSSVVFTFTSRKEAEQAITGASKFKDKTLVMTWYKPTHSEPATAAAAPSIVERLNSTDALEAELAAATAGDEADLEMMDDVDEDLLLGDIGDEEEDEDDDEDRSWRR